MSTSSGKAKGNAMLVGLGLDCDGHKRITTGPNFALLGGSEATHEAMVETAVRINEQLKDRGKQLSEVSRDEFDEIAHKAGLKRPAPERN